MAVELHNGDLVTAGAHKGTAFYSEFRRGWMIETESGYVIPIQDLLDQGKVEVTVPAGQVATGDRNLPEEAYRAAAGNNFISGRYLTSIGRCSSCGAKQEGEEAHVHLTGYGRSKAIRIGDVVVGDTLRYNYGFKSRVIAVEKKGQFVTIQTRSIRDVAGGSEWLEPQVHSRRAKATTLVGIAKRGGPAPPDREDVESQEDADTARARAGVAALMSTEKGWDESTPEQRERILRSLGLDPEEHVAGGRAGLADADLGMLSPDAIDAIEGLAESNRQRLARNAGAR